MNSVNLVGRLTRDPELKVTQGGVEIARFTVAVNRNYKNADGGYDADFINCTAFRHTAKFMKQYFSKGNQVGITGRIQTRSWEVEDGKRNFATEVIAENVTFVEKKKEAQQGAAVSQAANFTDSFADVSEQIKEDDLPF